MTCPAFFHVIARESGSQSRDRSNLLVEVNMSQLARIKNDYELKEYDYMSRTAADWWSGKQCTPQTVPLMGGFVLAGRVVLAGKQRIKFREEHKALLRRLNDAKAFKHIIQPPAGWFNRHEWIAETLTFGDNLVEILQIVGQYAQIKTLDYYSPVPAGITLKSHPELVHRETVVTRKNTLIKPGKALNVYIFLISKGPLWIQITRLDFEHLK